MRSLDDRFLGREPPGYDASMPRLVCWSCGRQIYTVAPLDALFAEERRCPRCGAFLNPERREIERRGVIRRQNAADDPGPPEGQDRRVEERRKVRRRRAGNGDTRPGRSSDGTGWVD